MKGRLRHGFSRSLDPKVMRIPNIWKAINLQAREDVRPSPMTDQNLHHRPRNSSQQCPDFASEAIIHAMNNSLKSAGQNVSVDLEGIPPFSSALLRPVIERIPENS
jgi:hypothetical protein